MVDDWRRWHPMAMVGTGAMMTIVATMAMMTMIPMMVVVMAMAPENDNR